MKGKKAVGAVKAKKVVEVRVKKVAGEVRAEKAVVATVVPPPQLPQSLRAMPREKRTIVVGDVHGCYDELVSLLFQVELGIADRLVFAGDLIDKGPASAAVVQYVRQLRNTGLQVTLVMGNHEEKALRWGMHARAERDGLGLNPMKDPDGRYKRLFDALTLADVELLEGAVLYTNVPGGMVVHAGVTPDMPLLPIENGRLFDYWGVQRRQYAQMLRVRRVRDGSMVPLGEEMVEDPAWWGVYEGRFGHIYCGHSAVVVRTDYVSGIDSGCVYGGSLTAAVISQDGKNVRFVEEPARKAYAERHRGGVED